MSSLCWIQPSLPAWSFWHCPLTLGLWPLNSFSDLCRQCCTSYDHLVCLLSACILCFYLCFVIEIDLFWEGEATILGSCIWSTLMDAVTVKYIAWFHELENEARFCDDTLSKVWYTLQEKSGWKSTKAWSTDGCKDYLFRLSRVSCMKSNSILPNLLWRQYDHRALRP